MGQLGTKKESEQLRHHVTGKEHGGLKFCRTLVFITLLLLELAQSLVWYRHCPANSKLDGIDYFCISPMFL